jgi:hypothetical protein
MSFHIFYLCHICFWVHLFWSTSLCYFLVMAQCDWLAWCWFSFLVYLMMINSEVNLSIFTLSVKWAYCANPVMIIDHYGALVEWWKTEVLWENPVQDAVSMIPMQSALGLNPCLPGEKSVINCLSYGTTYWFIKPILFNLMTWRC